MNKITESPSHYRHLESMSTSQLLTNINQEDQKVAQAIERHLKSIGSLVDSIYEKMNSGGRLFYIGAGTSGRLGILDASECPPTFGVPHDWVVGLIAGGDGAIRKAVEYAEDDERQAWHDLRKYYIDTQDIVIGIAASGSTPYVVHGLAECRKNGITTGCITCNPNTPLAENADYPIEVIVGPEFVTGSTRMKAGTAQKLILNMLTTAVMIKLGRVKDNRMIDMQLTNNKLKDRGIRMVMNQLDIPYQEADNLLNQYGSVRAAIESVK